MAACAQMGGGAPGASMKSMLASIIADAAGPHAGSSPLQLPAGAHTGTTPHDHRNSRAEGCSVTRIDTTHCHGRQATVQAP